MVSNITKRSKSGGIDKVSKWRSPERNIGVRVSELTGLDMVVTHERYGALSLVLCVRDGRELQH